MMSNVCVLSLNNALPHPVCMTFLAGHHILSSIHANIFPYFFWISAKHFINIFSSDQNICAITGDWFLSVNKCLMTHGGLMIYPSAFINSVHNHNSYISFSPYLSKISFTIWRKVQSVYPSMGASQSIMVHTVRKLKKISSEKIYCFLLDKRYSFSMKHRLSRRCNYRFRKLEGRFRSLLFIFFITSIYFVLLYKRQNPGMTPLMVTRFFEQIVDGRPIVLKYTRVPIEAVSDYSMYAVMAGEDQKFLDHYGFDFDAIWSAVESNVKSKSLRV